MPTYGYECTQCGNDLEVFQRITDEPLKTCQDCGGDLRKLVFPVGIVFKGSGFYVNDYANKSKSDSITADKQGESKASESKASEPKDSEPKVPDTKANGAGSTESTTTTPPAPEKKPETKPAAAAQSSASS